MPSDVRTLPLVPTAVNPVPPFAAASGMSDEAVYAGVEKALRKYFGKRGEQVVQDNLTCVKRGYSEMQQVPEELIQS